MLTESEFTKGRQTIVLLTLAWFVGTGVAIVFAPVLGGWIVPVLLMAMTLFPSFRTLRTFMRSYESFEKLARSEPDLWPPKSTDVSSSEGIKRWSVVTQGLVFFFFGGLGALTMWVGLGNSWLFVAFGVMGMGFAAYVLRASLSSWKEESQDTLGE